MPAVTTDVAIAGADAAGLTLALELGRRGVHCTIIDAGPAPVADGGAPHAQCDVVYMDSLAGTERLRCSVSQGDPPADVAALRAALGRFSCIALREGCDIVDACEFGQGVRLECIAGGQPLAVRARYVVATAAAPATLRLRMGPVPRPVAGRGLADLHIESADLARMVPPGPARQYWFADASGHVVLTPCGGTRFVLTTESIPGDPADKADTARMLHRATGRACAYRLMSVVGLPAAGPCARRFRAGRRFAIGLPTPTARMGYDSGRDDAFNLGWKLAAVIQGWGGPALLDTYAAERGAVAGRIASYARAMADSLLALGPLDHAEFGTRWRAHVQREYGIHRLDADTCYDSVIVADESDVGMPVAAGTPGMRAPNVDLGGSTLNDHFGPDFTLLWLGVPSPAADWYGAADAMGLPLRLVPCDTAHAHAAYGADLVLIRPDGRVAWRGDIAADARAVLRRATLK